jgi:hypothetical protein
MLLHLALVVAGLVVGLVLLGVLGVLVVNVALYVQARRDPGFFDR